MLATEGISKRFGRTVALAGVDFDASGGEIHALVGENGAGKSTLINIFAGRLRPDSGAVTLDGSPIRPGSPYAALKAGIAAVYQSTMLFERMTWEENLALGGFGASSSRLDLNRVASQALEIARQLSFELPRARATVEDCSVAERVRLEILRVLSFKPRVLILDEPTGVLAPHELGPFLATLRRLRTQGRIVVLVTHKLGEALAVADRITVLRHGRVVAKLKTGETTEAELARLMIGELPVASPEALRSTGARGELAMALEDVTLESDGRRILDRVCLTLKAGEITGIAGVDGNGQAELIEVLAGKRRPTAGTLRLAAEKSGSAALAVIPQNRDLDGLVLDMPLWENLMLARSIRRTFVCAGGWLRCEPARRWCGELIKRFRVKSADVLIAASALSGGNRQRLVVARALAASPKVLVAHDVCRGLDVRAAAEMRLRLQAFARGDGAVLLVSSDLEELLGICGRLAVMSRGTLVELGPDERDPQRLGLLMAGRPEGSEYQ